MSRLGLDLLVLFGMFAVLSVYEHFRVAHQRRLYAARRRRAAQAAWRFDVGMQADNRFAIVRQAAPAATDAASEAAGEVRYHA